MQNGRFVDNSLGNSQKQSFYTYGAKGGVTYKVNGRNYFYANGFVGTKPPQFRDIFLSPRNRNDRGARRRPLFRAKCGRRLHAPRAHTFRARVTGYLTNFKNEVESNLFFAQLIGEFSTSCARALTVNTWV
jgi:hypothetical protein